MLFLGVNEAARQLRVLFPGKRFAGTTISAVCLGKRRHKTHLGFHFRFA